MSRFHVFKQSFWVMLRQGVSVGIGFFLFTWLARFVPPTVFGDYQFILSLLVLASVTSLPGLNTALFQAVARGYDGEYTSVVRKSFLWSLLGVPLLGVVSFYFFFVGRTTVGWGLLLAGVFLPFFYAPNTWDSFLQAKRRFDRSAQWAILQTLGSAFVSLWAARTYPGQLLPLLGAYLFSYAAFNGIYFWKSLAYKENARRDTTTFPYGVFLTKINAFEILANQLDKIVVGLLLGSNTLAVYFVGNMLARTIFDTSKAFTSLALPTIATQHTANFRRYWLLWLILIPVTGVMLWVLPYLVTWLFSDRYAAALRLAQISLIFLPFVFINLLLISHFWYYVKNRTIITWHTVGLAVGKLLFMGPLFIYFGTDGLAFLFGFQTVLSLVILLGLWWWFAESQLNEQRHA